jgi:SsrA-binding protein
MKVPNRKAHFDYQILEHFEAGINLTGAEVKAARLGNADLSGSFIKIIGTEAYLINSKIFPYEYARPENYDPNRTRKLLLHKKQIISLKSKTEGANLTIVPLNLYTTRNLIKLELALGKPKKKFEKREEIKKRDINRDIEETLKNER